jgi:hypothetical protein
MIPIDQFEKWLPLLDESARLYLNKTGLEEFYSISENEKESRLKALLEEPIANFTIVNDVYFRARWAEILKMIHPHKELKLLEIASGDADMIPQVMARTHPGSDYITANMNKILSKSLLAKTKDLSLNVKIVEDDASCIERHTGRETVDIIAFQHSINDVLQAILCDREGVDTIYTDWMDTLPKMIEILQKEILQNTLEEHVKIPFLGLLDVLLKVLKTGGIIAMNHYMFQLDLDWGYPPDLHENMILIVRQWIKELTGCKEVYFKGFETNWWIFLQKI